MAVSLYRIKKWIKMITGHSISHVNQGPGKLFVKNELKGYYNDLTEKVTKRHLDFDELPMSVVDSGEELYFAIEIFQYGLGAYDLYLLNDNKNMLRIAINCADWAVENQTAEGSWLCFLHENEEKPYSAMAQGEAISLLARIYKHTNDNKYYNSMNNALKFMLTSIDEGGTAEYKGDDVFLYEYTYSGLVLNGWIFSVWGLYDYWMLTGDEQIKRIIDKTICSLAHYLKNFDMKYWSFYDLDGRIASPFYHKLHIAQLTALTEMFDNQIFVDYMHKWSDYEKNLFYRVFAFLRKSVQKIIE